MDKNGKTFDIVVDEVCDNSIKRFCEQFSSQFPLLKVCDFVNIFKMKEMMETAIVNLCLLDTFGENVVFTYCNHLYSDYFLWKYLHFFSLLDKNLTHEYLEYYFKQLVSNKTKIINRTEYSYSVKVVPIKSKKEFEAHQTYIIKMLENLEEGANV